jgi:hypothetical protein
MSSWTSDMEYPLYYVDLPLIICNENVFKDGLLVLDDEENSIKKFSLATSKVSIRKV